MKIDATDQVLGRLASKIAQVLIGKTNPNFKPNALSPEKVVVYNVEKVKITGKKMEQKKYYHYSGYPGGLKERKMKNIFEKDPGAVLREAVSGMLPKNRLRKKVIRNLIIHKGEKQN